MPIERARGGALALRTRLLAAMLAPMLAIAVLLGLAGATLIADVVRRTNDRVLGGALGAVAETVQVERGEVTLDLPAAAFGMLENSERDNVYYRIAVGGRLLTGYGDLPAPHVAELALDTPRFRFARYRGQDIRVAEVRRALPRIDAPVVVQVAETLDGRRALQRRLVIALVLGEILLVGVAMLLIRPALAWSLRPLAGLRGAVSARDRRATPDLSPLDTGPLPVELRSLADAFNHLLARLDSATAGMRRFTADASHQMRTPLAVLKVQVALARRGSPTAMGEIADAADRLEHLVTQLLALARAEEAGVAPPRERVDLREVAVAVINRRIAQAIEAGVEIHLDAPADLVIASHRTLVFEILSNLLDNAIRYNRRGGQVMMTISGEQGTGARIVVADDGPGLPDADLARLGERFTRLSTARDSQGSGLGLAIVRSAASRLDASLEIVSTRPGLRVTLGFGAAGMIGSDGDQKL
ncbi:MULTISPECIES: sensor histidine kinase N-terminal domain-containing protein [unclassified Sphingomonas]|uniref:sensor histidine kinase n=1 Tax=unclassified Sphingomonas TaxID=196159 RepID=UPI002854D7B4|nr:MULTISPECIES: sensor histidine kinase N-terminal domain-containing protein [unclassified Sphingomonas]MDR6116353.1 two-component system sensor histidine kinase TctE [Sphingomonas sp. SORGH_AS_0789]MDR6149972.1 two-component system sensor histidine kinase TctE [Sphingomonas sp. SORGH_AS_0742]